jgi:solute carrier family 10 (sodium/bile acid cotransporter), member 2
MRAPWIRTVLITLLALLSLPAPQALAAAAPLQGEDLYRYLSGRIIGKGDTFFAAGLNERAETLDWARARRIEAKANLRLLAGRGDGAARPAPLYFIRSTSGELFILSVPSSGGPSEEGLRKMTENRMRFSLLVMPGVHEGSAYTFARLEAEPEPILFDRIFKVSIICMLFLVMVGMGLTLQVQDFMLVFQKPRGIVVGLVMQYGLMPLIAYGLGRAMGYDQAYPFIFLGLILATASPAGVTSNLMTHFSRGDLALSVTLPSISTVMALFCTPLLLSLYGTMGPDASVPGGLIAKTIIVLVIAPLAVGMLVRMRLPGFARKAAPVLSALGLLTVLFIMVTGVATNIEVLSDVRRYSVSFYFIPLVLALTGMLMAAGAARLCGVTGVQVRSIAFESGVRNSALSMTLAILIQDQIGDFYSSLFIVNGVYGLEMYLAGIAFVMFYRRADRGALIPGRS